MTTPLGDDSNELPLPAANLLINVAAALLKAVRHASPSASDPTEVRIAKQCFRAFFVGTVTSAAAMLVLQPPAT